MKLTKYGHACFTLEKDEQTLVVDPGGFTDDLPELENVVSVVVTHVHEDHFDINALEALFARNPDMKVFSPQQVDNEIASDFTHEVVSANETRDIGPFRLEFFGGKHAIIHESMGQDENVGVMIDDLLYFPGDSFTAPEKPVKYLMIPAAAPWMKFGEAIDFANKVKADYVMPMHDAIASDNGKNMADQMIGGAVEKYGGTYQRLSSGESLDINE